MAARSATRWDERRKVAVEALKKHIEKLSKGTDDHSKDKLAKATLTLANTQANMGKGLTACQQ